MPDLREHLFARFLVFFRLISRTLFIFIFIENNAFGDDSSDVTPEIVVTGTITDDKKLYDEAPKFSLSANDIKALNPPTTVDLLRRIPGLDVTQQGGPGGITFVSIRGGDPNFTVVLVDGVKVDDPTNSRGGGFDFSGLDPLMIHHIDVFYGAFSAVFGSDALGGIVSITTKGLSQAALTGVIEVGTNDAWASSLHVYHLFKDKVGASLIGVVRNGGDAIQGDSLDRAQASFKVTNDTDAHTDLIWRLNLFASNTDATSFPIASGGDKLAVLRSVETRSFSQNNFSAEVSWHPKNIWMTKFRGGRSSYDELNDSPGVAPGVISGIPPVITQSAYTRSFATTSNTFWLNEQIVAGLGAEVIREDGRIQSQIDFGFPVTANFDVTRDTFAIFSEIAVEVNKSFSVIGSIRHDNIDSISTSNGRISATANIAKMSSTITFTIADAFKLPSLFALGHPLTGNLNLKPESSRNYSLEYEKSNREKSNLYSITFFYNNFEDLIDFDTTEFTLVNRSNVNAKGVDLTLEKEFGTNWQGAINIGYLDTTVDDGAVLERRPDWKGNFSLTWSSNDIYSVILHGNINGDFYDVAVPTGQILLDGYADVDVSFHIAISPAVKASFMIDNVFNNEYQESIGFSTLGRQLRFAISMELK